MISSSSQMLIVFPTKLNLTLSRRKSENFARRTVNNGVSKLRGGHFVNLWTVLIAKRRSIAGKKLNKKTPKSNQNS